MLFFFVFLCKDSTDESSQGCLLGDEVTQLLESRINNTEGTWVQCCTPSCSKWRYVPVIDPTELPEEWHCFMNNGAAQSNIQS